MIPLWPDTLSDEFDALASVVMRIARIPYDAAIVAAELILGRSRRRLILRRPPPLELGTVGERRQVRGFMRRIHNAWG